MTGNPGLMFNANRCRAVVGIAFGGLVPQCSGLLADAIAFTVGASFGERVDQLELLINELHSSDRGANYFGDYVTVGCQALDSVDRGYHYATPSRYDTQEAAAVFARYMNFLEVIARRCKITPSLDEGDGDMVEIIFEDFIL